MAEMGSGSKVELESVVVGWVARRSDRWHGRSEAEVVEDAGGDVGVGDEREHAEVISTPRALGDVFSENPAQERGPIQTASEGHRGRRRGVRRDGGAWARCARAIDVQRTARRGTGRMASAMRDQRGAPARRMGNTRTHTGRANFGMFLRVAYRCWT